MSGLSNLIFGEPSTPSQVVDTTPNAYMGLRQPLSQQLIQSLTRPQQYAGPYTAQAGSGELSALSGINTAAQNIGSNQYGQQLLAGSTGFNPYAQLSGLEQFGLGNVTQQAFSQSPLLAQSQGFLGQQLQGQMNPFAFALGPSGAEMQGLNSVQQTAFGVNPLNSAVNQGLQGLVGAGVHPQLDQLIQAATRPIIEQFGDQQLAQRSQFNAAGQQVQNQGSSPFAMADARLRTGVANALGDTGAQLTAQLNAQQQQAQLQALGLAQQQPGLELQNQLQGLSALGLPRELAQFGLGLQSGAYDQSTQNQFGAAGLADQFSGNALQRALAGLDAAGTGQNRQSAAFENQANRQQTAGSQIGAQQLQTEQAQLQGQLQNLEAQALPRLIEQFGISAGLEQFNQQRNELMQLMALIGNLSTGSQAVLPGVSGTPGLAQSFLSGFGSSLGGSLGGGG